MSWISAKQRLIPKLIKYVVESCNVQGLPELFGTVYGPQRADVPTDGYDATAEEERR